MGCPLIHLDYAAQLEEKRARLDAAIARYPALRGIETPISPSALEEEYRTRVKFAARDGLIGLYGRAHDVVDIPHCVVATPATRATLEGVRDRAKDCVELTHALRAIDLRETENEHGEVKQLLTFVLDETKVQSNDAILREQMSSFLDALVVGVALSRHDGKSPQLLGRSPELVAGIAELPDRVGESTHLATFGAFVQTNRATSSAIHSRIRAHLARISEGRSLVVNDLYGGAGSIGLAVAQDGHAVTLIESFAPSAERAERMARKNGVPLSARAANADELETFEGVDVVIVNPPRRGIARSLREALGASRVPHLAYVSCDPDTLARDLDDLRVRGYIIDSLEAFDMMPQTREVETLAFLHFAGNEPAPFRSATSTLLLAEISPAQKAEPGFGFVTLGTSGLALKGNDATLEERPRFSAVALLVGRVRPKLLARLDLDVVSVEPLLHHSLVTFTSTRAVRLADFRNARCAVIGDPRGHAPTNRYFLESFTLDRPFLHFFEWKIGDGTFRSELPGDLATVLARAGRTKKDSEFAIE